MCIEVNPGILDYDLARAIEYGFFKSIIENFPTGPAAVLWEIEQAELLCLRSLEYCPRREGASRCEEGVILEWGEMEGLPRLSYTEFSEGQIHPIVHVGKVRLWHAMSLWLGRLCGAMGLR